MPEPTVYLAHERPDVEVLWEGAWCPGELRMQRQDSSGQWLSNVQHRPPGELSSHIDTLRASEVRSDAKGDSILLDDPVRGAIDTTHLDSTTRIITEAGGRDVWGSPNRPAAATRPMSVARTSARYQRRPKAPQGVN